MSAMPESERPLGPQYAAGAEGLCCAPQQMIRLKCREGSGTAAPAKKSRGSPTSHNGHQGWRWTSRLDFCWWRAARRVAQEAERGTSDFLIRADQATKVHNPGSRPRVLASMLFRFFSLNERQCSFRILTATGKLSWEFQPSDIRSSRWTRRFGQWRRLTRRR